MMILYSLVPDDSFGHPIRFPRQGDPTPWDGPGDIFPRLIICSIGISGKQSIGLNIQPYITGFGHRCGLSLPRVLNITLIAILAPNHATIPLKYVFGVTHHNASPLSPTIFGL